MYAQIIVLVTCVVVLTPAQLYCCGPAVDGFPICDAGDGLSLYYGTIEDLNVLVQSWWFVESEGGTIVEVTKQCTLNTTIPSADWCDPSLPQPIGLSCNCNNVSRYGEYHGICGHYGECIVSGITHCKMSTPVSRSNRVLLSTELNTIQGTLLVVRNNVTVIFDSFNNNSLCFFVKSSWSSIAPTTGVNCTAEIPDYILATSADISVMVYQSGKIVFSDKFWQPGLSTCKLLGNWICCDDHNVICNLMFSSWWWLVPFGILSLLLIWYIPMLLILVSFLIWVLMLPIYLCIYGWKRLKKRNVRQQPQTWASKYAVQAASVLMLIGRACACDSGGYLQTSVTDCVANGATEICSVTLNTQITLPFLNATSCLSILDQQSNLIGKIEIKYTKSQETVSLSRLYYTGPWYGASASHHHCWSVDYCSENYCQQLDPVTDTDCYGEITNELVVTWPGRSSCRRSCGCASCGCFFCTPSCVFSRWAVIPSNTSVYSVWSPVNVMRNPTLQVKIDVAESVAFTQYVTQQVTTKNGYTLTIIGSLQGSSTVFGSNKIITGGTNAWYGFASDPNGPVAGSVGDIQAVSSSYVSNPSVSAFLFPWYSVTPQEFDHSTTYSFPSSGIHSVDHYTRFPTAIGSTYYTVGEGYMVGEQYAPGPLMIQLSTINPVQIVRTRNIICPQGTFVNGTGCYSCPTPATIFIEASSYCLSGSVVIERVSGCFTMITASISLTTNNQKYQIQVMATCDLVNGAIKLRSATEETTINIYFTTVEYIPVNNNTNGNSTIVPPNPDHSSWLNLFSKWFPKLPSWAANTLDTILFIAIAGISLVLLFYLVKILIWIGKTYIPSVSSKIKGKEKKQ